MLTGFISLVVMAGFAAVWSPAEPAAEPCQDLAPNEVRVYTQPGFAGPFKSWLLEPGRRQVLVPEISPPWEGHIASIQMGPEVGVMLFQNKFFRFSGSGYVYMKSSVPDIQKTYPTAPNVYASMIIHHSGSGNPIGILAGSSKVSEFRFFPMPEPALERNAELADIRNLVAPIDFVMFFPSNRPDEKVDLTLFSDIMYKGDSLKLPVAGKDRAYHLADYNFAEKAASLKMQLPPAGGIQQITPQVSNLVGRWLSSDGRTFEIAQQGENIVWMDMKFGLQGKGRINFNNIEITWYELYGEKKSTWKIITRDNTGLPTKIEIGSGLELTRLSSLTEPIKP
jgi:hypothetical protein